MTIAVIVKGEVRKLMVVGIVVMMVAVVAVIMTMVGDRGEEGNGSGGYDGYDLNEVIVYDSDPQKSPKGLLNLLSACGAPGSRA